MSLKELVMADYVSDSDIIKNIRRNQGWPLMHVIAGKAEALAWQNSNKLAI